MRKQYTLFLTICLMLILTSCSEPKIQKAVLTKDDAGVHSQYVMEAEDDIVQRVTQTVTKDCSAYIEKQMDIVRETVEQYKSFYEELEGVSYTADLTDTELVETIVIETSNPDTIITLSEAGLMSPEGDDTISLTQSMEALTAQGWTLKETEGIAE